MLHCTSLRNEIVMQDDQVHAPRPDQQRIRCIRSAEIAMAAAFYDQPQIVVAGEIDRGNDVTGRLGCHCIDARLRFPGIDPPRRLRQGDVVADVIGILEFVEASAASCSIRRFAAGAQRRNHLHEPPPDCLV
jgi:hypothetical protein